MTGIQMTGSRLGQFSVLSFHVQQKKKGCQAPVKECLDWRISSHDVQGWAQSKLTYIRSWFLGLKRNQKTWRRKPFPGGSHGVLTMVQCCSWTAAVRMNDDDELLQQQTAPGSTHQINIHRSNAITNCWFGLWTPGWKGFSEATCSRLPNSLSYTLQQW